MHKKTALWMPVSLSVVIVACAMLGLRLSLDDPAVRGNAFAVVNRFLGALLGIAFGLVGALILARQPRNTVAWLSIAIAIGNSILMTALNLLGEVMHPIQNPDWTTYLYFWANGWIWWTLMGPLLLILLVFPTGRLLSPRWRWVVFLLGLDFVVFLVLGTIGPSWQEPNSGQVLPNPFGQLPLGISLGTLLIPYAIAFLATGTLCVASVGFRFRRSNAVEREQLKWFLYAGAILIVFLLGGFLSSSGAKDALSVLGDCALLFIPISIGIAILRHHLFDIDIIIRRTLIYSVLTVILALFYVGSVLLLQQLLRLLTGQGTDLAIILSTLGSAALFNPLRRRIQRFIDRRFYRAKYNAARVLEAFGAALRGEVDLRRLSDELIAVVDETLQPAQASLWLRPARHSTANTPHRQG